MNWKIRMITAMKNQVFEVISLPKFVIFKSYVQQAFEFQYAFKIQDF